jgi:glutamate carboxypeptidase
MPRKNFAQQIQTHFDTNLPRYLALLKRMVAINSFTANAAGVNELGALTAEAFARLGFEAEFVQSAVSHYGKHLVLTRPGRGGRKIGLVSHLDTVFPPEEEARNNFAWREDGDKVYGPGTVDIKGGTVMMVMVLEALQQHAPDAFEEITWVLLIDAAEEAEAEDFGALCIERLAGPETLACLIFEGGAYADGDFKIVVTRKGMAVFQVTVEGRAAHAGTSHEQGANAIVQLAHTLTKIGAMTDYDRQLTYNIGTVSGGTVTNRVPHQAEARLEMRTFDPEVYEAGVEQMLALNGASDVASPADGFPCTVTVEVLRKTQPWPRNEQTDHLYSLWSETAAELDYKTIPEFRGGLSDGNHFWHAIPTTDGLGPSGKNAHCSEQSEDGSKEQEYVLVSSFVPKALLNTLAILKLIDQAKLGS